MILCAIIISTYFYLMSASTTEQLASQLASFNPEADDATQLPADLLAAIKRDATGVSTPDGRRLNTIPSHSVTDPRVQATCRALKIGFHDRVALLVEPSGAHYYFTTTQGGYLGSTAEVDECA